MLPHSPWVFLFLVPWIFSSLFCIVVQLHSYSCSSDPESRNIWFQHFPEKKVIAKILHFLGKCSNSQAAEQRQVYLQRKLGTGRSKGMYLCAVSPSVLWVGDQAVPSAYFAENTFQSLWKPLPFIQRSKATLAHITQWKSARNWLPSDRFAVVAEHLITHLRYLEIVRCGNKSIECF